MERGVRWGIDVAVALGWVAAGALTIDLEGWQLPAAIGATFLVGFISGRYRVIALTAVAAVAAAVLLPSDSCGTGCEDDIAEWFVIAYSVFLLGVIGLIMASGVLVRRRLDSARIRAADQTRS